MVIILIAMLVLLFGEDVYRMNRHLAQLRDDFCRAHDPQGLNVFSFDAGKGGAEDLLEASLTVPFLSGEKFVVARGFLSSAKAVQESLLASLDRVPESTTLVFVERATTRDLSKSPLYNVLSGKPGSREFPAITPRSVASTFAAELRSRGVSLVRGAERHAAAMLPADSWQIVQEADKVAAYVVAHGRTEVTVEDLSEVISGGREESVFSFLDACLEGDPGGAVGQLVSLMDGGMSEYQVIGAVTRQVRTLVAVRDALDRGVVDKAVIAREMKMHPYPVEKAMRAVRNVQSKILRRLFGLCLDTETSLKTSGSGREAVELLAVRLAVVARG